jgi:hypothetical protein
MRINDGALNANPFMCNPAGARDKLNDRLLTAEA